MIGTLAKTLTLVVAALVVASAVACSTGGAGNPPPPNGVTRELVRPAGSRPAIAVTSVVPAPGPGTWIGSIVLLDYSPLAGDVVLGRSRLSINGRARPARVTWTALTPISSVVIFAWKERYPPGVYSFRADLGTTGGGAVVYAWTASTR